MNVNDRYFEWMYRIAVNPDYTDDKTYYNLCRILDEIEFYYIHPMDENRFEDGIGLRYRFAYEKRIDNEVIETEIQRPCSVFEMMVALSLRLEEDIMRNFKEDRTSVWFLDMLENLDLLQFDDANAPLDVEEEVNERVDRFLRREYESNGEGGLFTVRNPRQDMRDTEIWYQAMWYLTDLT